MAKLDYDRETLTTVLDPSTDEHPWCSKAMSEAAGGCVQTADDILFGKS